jgi:Nuclease-related domain
VAAYFVRQGVARGVVIGAGITGTIALLHHWVVLVTGTGPTMMGDLAEQWTASELRKLRKLGWRVVNHFGLGAGDIDHVVIGPAGTFVVETKWSASPWADPYHRERITEAWAQVVESARQLKLWHNFKRLHLADPRPVVMLWGERAKEVASQDSNMTVLAGLEAVSWFQRQPPDVQSEVDVEAVWSNLAAHLDKRDMHEARRAPLPASAQELAVVIFLSVGVGLCAFLAAAGLMKVIRPLVLWGGLAVGLCVLPLPLRRSPRMRPLTLGWCTGVAFAVVLALVLWGREVLR